MSSDTLIEKFFIRIPANSTLTVTTKANLDAKVFFNAHFAQDGVVTQSWTHSQLFNKPVQRKLTGKKPKIFTHDADFAGASTYEVVSSIVRPDGTTHSVVWTSGPIEGEKSDKVRINFRLFMKK